MLGWSYNLFSVFVVNLLATTGDVTLSWTSPVYPKLYSNDSSVNPLGRPITEAEDGWLGSLLTIGAIVGPFPFGFIARRFGRKISLLCLAMPHIVSFFTMAFARTIYLFYLGRILGGLSLGGGFTLLPMYIAEISQDANRGMMSLTLNIFWAIGNFLPYVIGPFTSILWFNIIMACIPTAFVIIFFIMGTETPYFLVERNKIAKAEKALMRLRSEEKRGIETELESIKTHLKRHEEGTFFDILRQRGLRKAFFICIVLIIAQEMSGFMAVLFYLQPIFEAAETTLPSDISALIVGSVLLVSSFIAPFLVDRAGRRILLVCSSFGMSLALLVLGIFFYLQDSTNHSTERILWMPIFSLIFFIVSFNLGVGSIPWTLCSELFPSSVKEIAASIQSSVCWITSFLVTRFFNNMNDGMGRAGTFWFFSAFAFFASVFSMIFVPETKGKSFSEIQDMLKYGFSTQTSKFSGHPELKTDVKMKLNMKETTGGN